MFSTRLVFLGTIIMFAVVNGQDSLDMENLTSQQRDSVTSLKEILKNATTSHDFEDYFLTNFLKVVNYKVEDAIPMLNQYLQFMSEQNISQIMDEDWSDMRILFPYSRDTMSKSGHPVLYVDMGQWDAVSYLTTQEAFDRLIRYSVMMHEESDRHVRRLRSDGRNISQYSQIINVGGFRPSKHVCVQCAYLYRDVTQLLAPYAPVRMERAVFVNVPYLFKKMVYYFFSEDTKKFVFLYEDPNQLEKMLVDYIDPHQLPSGMFGQVAEKDNSKASRVWIQRPAPTGFWHRQRQCGRGNHKRALYLRFGIPAFQCKCGQIFRKLYCKTCRKGGYRRRI